MEDYKAILLHRVKLLDKAKNNKLLQDVEIATCKQDILYFFKNYLYTNRNDTIFSSEEPDDLPFIPFDFQEEYIREVRESITEGNKPVHERKPWVLTNVFVEKSRQMGISWLTAAIFLYWFLFHKHKYTIISRTEDEVDKAGDMDSMFEKIRYMIRNLPDWMLPDGFNKALWRDKSNAHMSITDPKSHASITWKTANPDAGRWGTRNCIFMDEMAFMQYAQQINKAAWSNTPCRIFASTPNGEGNEFYRMRKRTVKRKENGVWVEPDVKWLRYHWKDHPLYDDEWYKWKTQGMDAPQIAQELDINYNVAIVGRVYPEFSTQVNELAYDMTKPLYVAIDNSHWGADPNAIIVMQPQDQYWNIIDAIEVRQTPENCAEFLACVPKFQMNDMEEAFQARYRTYLRQRAIFVSDPYDTMSALGNSSIYEDYKKVGINLFMPQTKDKKTQIGKTRTNLFRIRYNENCDAFASAIMNARYPERKETSNATTEAILPVHNWTSHYRTALEYLVMYLIENPMVETKRILEDNRPKRDYVTWKLYYV